VPWIRPLLAGKDQRRLLDAAWFAAHRPQSTIGPSTKALADKPRAARWTRPPLPVLPDPDTRLGGDEPQQRWLQWADADFAPLREAGFELLLADDLTHWVTRADSLQVGLQPQGEDANTSPWFDLSLGMEINGVRHNILPWLPSLIAQASAYGALADAGGGVGARVAQAVALYETGDLAEARKAAEAALAKDPKNVAAANVLVDLARDFAVGKPSHGDLAHGEVEVAADVLRERRVGRPAKDLQVVHGIALEATGRLRLPAARNRQLCPRGGVASSGLRGPASARYPARVRLREAARDEGSRTMS
jgi:hypothetical protein